MISVATDASLIAQRAPGPLERLLEPVHFRAALVEQRRAVPGEFPQLALGPVRHEAGPQQSVPQQVGQPLAVLHVRLPPRHLLDMLRVNQQQLKAPLQQVEEGLPIDAGAFHRHMRYPLRRQPVGERPQVICHRPEGPHLLAGCPAGPTSGSISGPIS